MDYKTKFEIGDIVFLIHDNKVAKGKITGIDVSAYNNKFEHTINTSELYIINYDEKYPVNVLFKTKEELLKSL